MYTEDERQAAEEMEQEDTSKLFFHGGKYYKNPQDILQETEKLFVELKEVLTATGFSKDADIAEEIRVAVTNFESHLRLHP